MKIIVEYIRHNIILFIIMFLLILATGKYVLYGEKYSFETDCASDYIELSRENEISQDIIIDEKSRWNKDSYCLKFSEITSRHAGTICFSFYQNDKIVQTSKIEVTDIPNDTFYSLDGIDYTNMHKGTATIRITGNDLEMPVKIHVVENTYNIPNCQINGQDIGKTLVQKYSFYYLNEEYFWRLLMYGIFIILTLSTCYITSINANEDRKICNFVQVSLILSFIAVIYIYDSSFFYEPTWAEAVTNFAHNAVNQGILKNLVTADAGYLPLFQRLITLFLIQVLHLNIYHALYLMQMLAYIISGYILSLFVKKPYQSFMDIKYRYVISLLIMMQLASNHTGAFINFIAYGIYMILIYFLADSANWNKREFISILLISCLSCLSKGQYVILFPFLLFCFFIFYKNFNKRDKVFIGGCLLASMLQLVYYFFSPEGGKGKWIDRTGSSEQAHYVIRLICDVIRDVPMSFLSLFEQNIVFFNGIALIITFVFWIVVLKIFYSKVLKNWLKKEQIDNNFKIIYMLIIFLTAQFLFFRITVWGTSNYRLLSDEFWNYYAKSIGERYELFAYIPVLLCYVVLGSMVMRKNPGIKKYLVSVFGICIMLGSSRLQIKGINTDFYSTNRYYRTQLYSEYCLLKDIEKVECRAVPIQPEAWIYKKNANLYYIGTNIFDWDAELVSNSNVIDGKINLYDYSNINNESGIWQIFLEKNNLISNSNYILELRDRDGKMIQRVSQDNSKYQKMVSFSFEEAVYNVSEISILNDHGQNMNISNAIYFVTQTNENLLKDSMLNINIEEGDTHIDILDAVIEQPFVAANEEIYLAQIYFGTYQRINTGIINIEVCDKSNNIIVKNTIEAKSLSDNSWHDIHFKNCKLKEGEVYTLRIYSNDFEGDNNVAVYVKEADSEFVPNVKINGLEQSYKLGVKLYGGE